MAPRRAGVGWLERARLLEHVEGPSPEAAWVALPGAHKALLVDHDLAEVLRAAPERGR